MPLSSATLGFLIGLTLGAVFGYLINAVVTSGKMQALHQRLLSLRENEEKPL